MDNNIEFMKNSDRATASFTQGRFISKMKKLISKHPEESDIHENEDGSILCHFPVSWIKVTPPRQMSEEQRQAVSERMRNYRNCQN